MYKVIEVENVQTPFIEAIGVMRQNSISSVSTINFDVTNLMKSEIVAMDPLEDTVLQAQDQTQQHYQHFERHSLLNFSDPTRDPPPKDMKLSEVLLTTYRDQSFLLSAPSDGSYYHENPMIRTGSVLKQPGAARGAVEEISFASSAYCKYNKQDMPLMSGTPEVSMKLKTIELGSVPWTMSDMNADSMSSNMVSPHPIVPVSACAQKLLCEQMPESTKCDSSTTTDCSLNEMDICSQFDQRDVLLPDSSIMTGISGQNEESDGACLDFDCESVSSCDTPGAELDTVVISNFVDSGKGIQLAKIQSRLKGKKALAVSCEEYKSLVKHLTEREKAGLLQLCLKSTKWSPIELAIFVTTMKEHFPNVSDCSKDKPDFEIIKNDALTEITKKLHDRHDSDKTRQLVNSYWSNWNRRYPPMLEWLATFDESSAGPKKQAPNPGPSVDKDSGTVIVSDKPIKQKCGIVSKGRAGKHGNDKRLNKRVKREIKVPALQSTAEARKRPSLHVKTEALNTADVHIPCEVASIHTMLYSFKPVELKGLTIFNETTLEDMLAYDRNSKVGGFSTYPSSRNVRQQEFSDDLVVACQWLRGHHGKGDERLQSLDLTNCKITLEGFSLLANAIKNNQYLRELRLCSTGLQLQGLRALRAGLECNGTLTSLSIRHNPALHCDSLGDEILALVTSVPTIVALDMDWDILKPSIKEKILNIITPTAREKWWKQKGGGSVPFNATLKVAHVPVHSIGIMPHVFNVPSQY